jgi:hypothetical protein
MRSAKRRSTQPSAKSALWPAEEPLTLPAAQLGRGFPYEELELQVLPSSTTEYSIGLPTRVVFVADRKSGAHGVVFWMVARLELCLARARMQACIQITRLFCIVCDRGQS